LKKEAKNFLLLSRDARGTARDNTQKFFGCFCKKIIFW